MQPRRASNGPLISRPLAVAYTLMEFTINCPYCQAELPKKPQRKSKCPTCGKPIHVKSTPTNREKRLMTEEQANAADVEWAQYHAHQKHINIIQAFGFSEQDLEQAQRSIFSKKTEREAVWILLEKFIKQEQNLSKKGFAYYQMALLAEEEGKDFHAFLQESRRCELLKLQKNPRITKVKILTAGQGQACAECEKLSGKIFSKQEALKNMPIPCRQCTTILSGSKPGFCRCMYIVEL